MPRAVPVLIAAFLTIASAAICRAGTSDTVFTYQGELQAGGVLANGAFDMAFSLWDAAAGGAQLGGGISIGDVTVADGRFTVELDAGASAFDNGLCWLEIVVDGFTLSPRQAVTRAPYAIQTRGIFVDENRNVGIGTTNPQRQMELEAGESILRLTSTDAGPTNSSRIEFKAVDTPSAFAPFGRIDFLDAADTVRALIQGNKSGSNDAHLTFSVTPDELAQLRLAPSSVRVRDRIDLVRGADNSTAASIGSDGANSMFQLQGGKFGVGTASPTGKLEVVAEGLSVAIKANGNLDAVPGGGGIVVVGNEAGRSVAIDDNEIMARNAGSTSTLHLNGSGGEIAMGQHDIHPAFAYGYVSAQGDIINGSDNVIAVEHEPGSAIYDISFVGGIEIGTGVAIVSPSNSGTNTGYQFVFNGLRVRTRNLVLGVPGDASFSFVIYQP